MRILTAFLVVCSFSLQAEVCIVNSDKPSITFLDAVSWKTTSTLSIAQHPFWAEIDPTGQWLYVAHVGDSSPQPGFGPPRVVKQASSLSAIHLGRREIAATVPIDWRVRLLSFSEDRRYLLAAGRGKYGKTSLLSARRNGPFLPRGDVESSEVPAEIAATFTIVESASASVKARIVAAAYPRQALWSRDNSRVFILAAGALVKGKRWPKDLDPMLAAEGIYGENERLLVLSPDSAQPLADIPLERTPSMMALSATGRWLYVLLPGTPAAETLKRSMGGKLEVVEPLPEKRERVPGKLLIVDVGASKVANSLDVGFAPRGLQLDSHTDTLFILSQTGPEDLSGRLDLVRDGKPLAPLAVGLDPHFPVRCRDDAGVRLVSTSDIRLLPDNGPLAAETIGLNHVLKKGERFPKPAPPHLGDVPFVPICLPGFKMLAVVTPTVRVGLVDLERGKLAELFGWGVGGGLLGAFVAGLANMPLEGGEAISARPGRTMDLMNSDQMGSPTQERDSGPWQVVPRPDGAFLYSFDAGSGKVAVIGVRDLSIAGQYRFGQGCTGLWRPPGGKFIFGVHSGSVTVLDTTNNQIRFKHRLQAEAVRGASTRLDGAQLLVWGDQTLDIVDASTNNTLATVTALGKPVRVLEPGPPRPGP